MKNYYCILGTGGHGKVVADALEELQYPKIDFFGDDLFERKIRERWSFKGNTEMLKTHLTNYQGMLLGIGNCQARMAVFEEFTAIQAPWLTLIHPKAHVSRFAQLGNASFIAAGAVIAADARIGHACIVNTGATVDHDCTLADSVHISPGVHLAGTVTVGRCAWIGIGAIVKQGISIGENAVVGAGALVIRDVLSNTTVTGVPAKILDKDFRD